MMENTEIIKALRWCGSEDERHEMCVDETYRCPMWNEDRITDECKADLMLAAADALEAAEKLIDYLQKLVDINTERCEALRKQLRESHDSYEQRIAKLEAQKPTVDSVPVRCKDCKHHEVCKNGVNGWCNEHERPTDVTYFCADGERKQEQEQE